MIFLADWMILMAELHKKNDFFGGLSDSNGGQFFQFIFL